jgi:hypothetical protein
MCRVGSDGSQNMQILLLRFCQSRPSKTAKKQLPKLHVCVLDSERRCFGFSNLAFFGYLEIPHFVMQ